jgi:DNA-binding beta-propeller fold protein YncE
MRKLALISAFLLVPLVLAAAALSSEPDAIPDVNGTVYVTERTPASSSVTAYDAATGVVHWTTAVGSRPIGVVWPRGTDKVYSSDELANSMSVLDRETGAHVAPKVAMGPLPHHLMASKDGRRIYVAEFGWNQIGIVDTQLDQRVRGLVASTKENARTHAVWVPAYERFIYATNTRPRPSSNPCATILPGEIAKIDTESGVPVWEFPIGKDPSEILVSSKEQVAYVSVRCEHAIKVVDLAGAAPSLLATVPIGIEPDTLSLTEDRQKLIVGLRDTTGAKMAIMDTGTFAVQTVPLTGRTTGHQWLSQNSRYTFIAVEGPGTPAGTGGGVAVVDNVAGAQIDFYPHPTGGPLPHGVFFDPRRLR